MSESTASAPAIPPEARLPHLSQNSLGQRAAQVVEQDENCRALQFLCHQICDVYDLATSQLNIPISISAPAADSVVSALASSARLSTAWNLSRCGESSGDDWRSWASNLSLDSRVRCEKHSHNMPRSLWTRDNSLSRPHNSGWVNSFTGISVDELCKMKSSPQEAEYLEIGRCFLDWTLIRIAQFVQGRPTEFVFNPDQVVLQNGRSE
jgi:hypothetical protein